MRVLPRRARWAGGLGLVLAGLAGCQSNIAGMTLPSGHYLKHRPQYFPAEPSFPLPRELATQQAQNAAAAAANEPLPAGRPPAPVVPPPAVVPVPNIPPGNAPPAANPPR
jgi:hypothetical protein